MYIWLDSVCRELKTVPVEPNKVRVLGLVGPIEKELLLARKCFIGSAPNRNLRLSPPTATSSRVCFHWVVQQLLLHIRVPEK